MAYDASSDQAQDDEQQQNSANQSAGANGASQNLSGGGGGFAGQSGANASGSPSPSAASGPTSSGSWTNLNSYLSANSDQSPALGQAVASNVGDQAKNAQGDLATAQQGFQNEAPYQNVNGTTAGQVDQAFSNPSQYSAAGADVTTPENYLNNNWGFTPGQTDISTYAPTSGPSWANVTDEYGTAGTALQNTQSESGRQQLLQNQYGNNPGGYNQGEQKFDQLLLQQNPGNQTALNNVYSQYSPNFNATSSTNATPLDLNNALTASQAYDTAAKDKAAGFQTQAIGDLNNQISGLGSAVSGETTAASNATTDAYNKILSDIKSGQLTQDESQGLGITGPTHVYNENLANYVSPLNNVYAGSQGGNYAATQGDWANYAGLGNLVTNMSGNADQVAALGNVGLTGTAATQAQAPAVTPYTYNAPELQSALTADQASYQNAYTNPTGTTGFMPGSQISYQTADSLDAQNPGRGPFQSDVDAFNQAQGYGNMAYIVGNEPTPSPTITAQPQPGLTPSSFPGILSALEKDQNA